MPTKELRQPKPEIMSPAGHWPELKTAIEAGADAVFFGLNHFTARAKVGFTLEELPEVMSALHERGVKGFVTFNTLVFDHELKAAERAIEGIARAGADSIIVQDVGIAKLASQVAPSLNIHGSTQMSITSSEGAELARQFGANRVVLGRELSLVDIEKIRSQTDIEIEVFVHGALCVSYSGQCFSSEAWGGRSANRGKCAQACRLPYDLIVDDEHRDLGAYSYLLSPGDLYALHQVPELVRIGVSCLKIEGRYKDPYYVAATTQAYRKAVDEAYAGLELSITPEEEQNLEQVYSRGLGPYFMSGTDHQRVVDGRSPRHRGVYAGKVTRVSRNSVQVATGLALKAGDGLVFDAAHRRSLEEAEEGSRIYEVQEISKNTGGPDGETRRLELRFGHNEINFSRIETGDWLWRSNDPQVAKLLKPLVEAKAPVHTQALHMHVTGKLDDVLNLTATLDDGISATVIGQTPLQTAQKHGLDATSLEKQFSRLGGTGFHLGDITTELEGQLFVPVGELNQLRRDVIEQIQQLRTVVDVETTPKLEQVLNTLQEQQKTQNTPLTETPRLHVLVRTPEQLDAVIPLKPESITLDYLELYGLRPSVDKVKEAGIRVRVASPRILKPTEQNIIKFLVKLDCEILVRSGGLLQSLQALDTPPKMTGDFSLNAANILTSTEYLDMGISALTPTHDLNAQQISDLAEQLPPETLEVISYHHLPVFHTEHCVFCRFLSEGTDYTNCGHPCEDHKVALRDKQGRQHPIMADVGCRNTVFGAEAQTGGHHMQDWIQSGIRDFRIELVHESARQADGIVAAFQQAFAGELSFYDLESTLRYLAPEDTTEGSFFVADGFDDLPQLDII